jgi:hypothetical protein
MAIENENDAYLTKFPGIGKKTARSRASNASLTRFSLFEFSSFILKSVSVVSLVI